MASIFLRTINFDIPQYFVANIKIARTLCRKSSHFSSRIPSGTKIQIRGGKEFEKLKHYVLVKIPSTTETNPINLASLYAKRNVVFGTKLHQKDLPYLDTCRVLLDLALVNASENGDQPQGLASLTGLSAYIRYHLDEENSSSPIMEKLRQDDSDEGKIIFEAVRSVATMIPREGHRIVGVGTYIDAKRGWTQLAREYTLLNSGTDDEANLFLTSGGVLSKIEYSSDKEKYLAEAGGAMARCFFM